MEAINLIPVFITGLLGSVHCVGMCGGVVAAFSSAPGTQRRRFPVAVVSSLASAPAALMADGMARATRVLAYNTGRITSYCVAGAMAGGLAGGVGSLSDFSGFQIGAAWLVNLMLVARHRLFGKHRSGFVAAFDAVNQTFNAVGQHNESNTAGCAVGLVALRHGV